MSNEAATVSLGSITTWLSGGTPDRANTAYWIGPVPWISATTLKKTRVVDSDQRITETAVRAGSKLAPQGATLILVRGMALRHEVRASLAMRPVSFNQDVKALVPRPGLLPEYLTYAIHGQRTRILELVSSAGSGTGVLDTSLLKRLPIWLPAVDEQQAIIEVISDAEAATDVIENLIIKSRDRKMGMMQQLLTGRTRLPGYTEAWNSGPLKDFIPLQRGFDLPTSQVRTGPYPVVYSNGVARYHAQAMVQGPGVVTGRSGTIGNIHYVEQDYWPHNTALWVTSFARADARFVYYFLTHLGLEQFASGSGVPTLNRNDAHSFEISLPRDREEQNAIARVLTDADNEIAVLHGRLRKARDIKQGMMQQLLTGRTQLPIQESAL